MMWTGWKMMVVLALAVGGLVARVGPVEAENYSLATRSLGAYDEAANLHGYVGVKKLDATDWEGLDTQYVVGVDVDYATGPVAVVAAVFHSRASGDADGVDVDAQFTEAQLGARKTWYRFGGLRPYVGGGGTAVWMSISDPRIDADHRYTKLGLGLWAGGGVCVSVAGGWTVGGDLRGSYVPISVRGEDRNAGGWQAGLVVGYHWRQW